MKKVLAMVLAAALCLSLSAVVFANDNDVLSGAPSSGFSGDVVALYDYNHKDVITIDPIMYNKGNDKYVFDFAVPAGEKLRVDVESGAVSVTSKKIEDDVVADDGTVVDVYEVTVKAKAGVRDWDPDDFTIELDYDDQVVYLEGEVAWARVQEVGSDDRLVGSNADGWFFEFDTTIDDETRIRVHDYVDVYFKGNYGTDIENLFVDDDAIVEVEEYFDDVDVDYYDFVASPKFATKVKVIIDGDKNSVLYELNKKTGELTRVDADYESDGWAFTTKVLGCYVLAEEEYEAGNVLEEPVVESAPVVDEKENPGTGAY